MKLLDFLRGSSSKGFSTNNVPKKDDRNQEGF